MTKRKSKRKQLMLASTGIGKSISIVKFKNKKDKQFYIDAENRYFINKAIICFEQGLTLLRSINI